MDVQLQELIDKIKKDGIASAEQEANTIKENARKEADSIIADAKAKAESIIKEAQTENARLEKVSIDAI
jgi:V/A-type H+-transporting ATPase subunit E